MQHLNANVMTVYVHVCVSVQLRDIKEELAGLGERMEEMRGVCRQLQSQLKKFPDCSETPFEAEADTLMDNWLDVSVTACISVLMRFLDILVDVLLGLILCVAVLLLLLFFLSVFIYIDILCLVFCIVCLFVLSSLYFNLVLFLFVLSVFKGAIKIN